MNKLRYLRYHGRLWLADLFYYWACRLAGHDMIPPSSPEAPGAWGMVHAQRAERAAREWQAKYKQLRRKEADSTRSSMVQV